MQRKSRADSRRNRNVKLVKARESRKLILEALESRELLAADLIYSPPSLPQMADDLRMEAVLNGSSLSVRLMRGATQVATAAMDDSGDVSVNVKRDSTTAGELDPYSETLRIDLNSLSLLNTFIVGNGGVLTINFEGGVSVPATDGDHLFLESTGTANVGFGMSVITTAEIALNSVNANFNGNLLLRSNPSSSAAGTTLSPNAVLAFPSASIVVNGGSILASNITLEAKASKTTIVTAESDIPLADVIVNASAEVNIDNAAVINAAGTLTILAESAILSNVGRAPVDDGDATDDDTEEDAAIAVSEINNNTNVTIKGGSILTSTGSALITSNNLVTATSIADGMLGDSSTGGATLAITNVEGNTTLLVDSATITSGGNLSLLSNNIRSVTTQAMATPGGAKDDGDSSTTTRSESEIGEADASTSEGSVDFAAAVAIGNIGGITRAEINNASVKSIAGNLIHQAKLKNTVITKADSSTTNGSSGSGMGVAVAIQNTNTDALALIGGNSNVDGNIVTVDARQDSGNLTLDSISGRSGTGGSDDIGFAGSLAIGVTVANARARIANGATVNANGANMVLTAESKTTTTIRAVPYENGSGTSLGVGASVAVNILDQTTEAALGDAAALTNANNLSLAAQSDHTKTTETRAGASGGFAFAGAFSILVDNDDTLARLGTGAGTNVAGNLSLVADSKTQTNTKAQGDAEGQDSAGIGAAFALAFTNVATDARINRDVTVGGNMNLTSFSSGDADVLSTASASGGKKSSASGGEDADKKALDGRTSADARAASKGARSSSSTESNPSSSNSDGSIAVAAAFAINLPEWETRAAIPSGRNVTVGGQLNIKSFANHDGSTIADASAVKADDLGVGIAVALMSADVVNTATIGASMISAGGLHLEANMRNLAGDQQHNFDAISNSGAGDTDNSIAGSFSLSINTVKTQATISNLASIDAEMEDLTVSATSDAAHKVHARPKGAASGADFGLGLSFALAAIDDSTVAAIGEGVSLIDVNDLNINANSKSSKDILAEAGAEGDTAFGGAIAILVDNEDTIARLENKAGNTSVTGNVSITAEHTGVVDVKSDAKAQGVADAGIGISGSFVYLNEVTDAQLQRSMTIPGNLSILSTSSGNSTSLAKASASGAKKETGQTTDSKAQSQRATADTAAADSGARTSTSTQSNPSASTNSGGAIAVAAAVTINIAEAESRAAISANRTVTVNGITTLRSKTDHDVNATADGSATAGGGDLAVGVAVAIIGASVDNEATIGGNTTLTTDGLTVEAVMKDPLARHEFEASATSGAGDGDYGIAGSVTVSILDADATATLGAGAQIQGLAGQPVTIQAISNTMNKGLAKPNNLGGGGGSSLGLGGSFSLVRTSHDVEASVAQNANIANDAASLKIAALADHQTTSTAINGAKGEQSNDSGAGGSGGSVGIGAAVSLVLSNNHTNAMLEQAAAGTTVTGDAVIRTRHLHQINATADGNAEGGETGIGISFGLNQVDDHVGASLKRSLTANNIILESLARVDSDVETMASASGASGNGNNPDQEANAQRNPTSSGAASNTGDTKSLPSAADESNEASTSSSNQGGSGSSGLGIAASVAFNIIEVENRALVGSGVVLKATQTARVSANGHFDTSTKGLGESLTTAESDTVAAGVGFAYVDVDSLASIDSGSQVTANNVVVEAVTADEDSHAQINDFVAWGAAASGGDGDFSVAASVALNIIKLDYQASTSSSSSLKSSGDLTIQSEVDARPQTLAVTGALTTGKAFGAALAYAEVDVISKANLGGNADATNALKVDAATMVRTTQTKVPEFNENIDLNTVAIAGAAGADSLALAAAVAVDDYNIETIATIGENSQINQAADVTDGVMQSVIVEATTSTNVTTLVGTASLSLDGTGFGAGLQVGIVSNTTQAFIAGNADVNAKHQIAVVAQSYEKLIAGSANFGIGNSNGIAGSVAIYDVHTDTSAYSDDNSSLTTAGNISISADGQFFVTGIAGSIGAGGTTGAGAANTTILHNDEVQAWIGASSQVNTMGSIGLQLHATSLENIIGVSAAGAGGGSNALAGSATVMVLNETTKAFIQPGSNITADNGAAAGTPSIDVTAIDSTNIVTVAGNLAISGGTAVGVGADVTTLNKTTTAYIDSAVVAVVEGDIHVLADSSEDFTCVGAGLSASSGASVTVDAAVTILDISTRAFIGDDHRNSAPSLGPGNVHAKGNILVDANDNSQFDKVIGVLSAGGSVAGAAAVAVSSSKKLTEAFIGKNAKVSADGQGSAAAVKTGKFDVTFDNSPKSTTGINAKGDVSGSSDIATLKGQGEVGAANTDEMRTQKDGANAANDPSNFGQRVLAPATRAGFRGLSVTATNRDDIEVYTFAVSLGSGAAIAVSSGVSAVDNETYAFIDDGAQINGNVGGAHTDQSVNVTAGSDFSQIAINGAAAVGSAGISPAVGIALVNLTTEVWAAGSIKAKDDVYLEAHGSEDLLLVGMGLAGGASVGIGGTVNVMDFKPTTTALVKPNTVLVAEGNILIQARDDSDVDLISGAAGIGGGAGVGAGVGVMMFTKVTEATIGENAQVDAFGDGNGVSGIFSGDKQENASNVATGFETTSVKGLIVQASSYDNYMHLCAVAGGGFIGVAGGVGVTLIDSDTYATIESGAKINQLNNNAGGKNGQSVYVNSANQVDGFSFAGAVAGGLGAMSGAVDFGTIKNDSFAVIESSAKVRAKEDVEVNALGIKDVEGFAISGAGGLVGIAGSVSVWSIGSQLNKQYKNDEPGQAPQDADNSKKGSADEDAASQGETAPNEVTKNLDSFKKNTSQNDNSSQNRQYSAMQSASGRLTSKAPSKANILNRLKALAGSEPGTTARIAAGAIVQAGDDINVTSNEDTTFQTVIGSVAGGAVGVGGSVAVNTFSTNSTARAGGTLAAGGDLNVVANLDQDTNTFSIAGAGGLVGLGAAVVSASDSTAVQAYIDNGATVTSANNITIKAMDDREHKGETGQISAGGIAAGVSFVVVNLENPAVNETTAFIGDDVIVGSANSPVQNITIEAKPSYSIDTNVFGLSAGVGAASINFSRANVRPDTHATIGDSNVYASGDVKLIARPTINAEVTGTGVAAGGVGAGIMLANLEVGRGDGIDEVQAGLFSGATVNAKSLIIEADSQDTLDVEVVAGSGGAVATTWAKGTLKSDQSTLAQVGTGGSLLQTNVHVDKFRLRALHDQDFDTQADAATIGLAAGSGAGTENRVTGRAKALIGDTTIDAQSIVVDADNNVDKKRYGSNNGVNLSTVSISAGSVSGLNSSTSIGTSNVPLTALVDIKPGAVVRARGTADSPGILDIDVSNDIDAVDRTNAEEYSAAVGVTVAIGQVNVDSNAAINMDGAMLVNKFGEVNLTSNVDSVVNAFTDVNAASGVSSQISSNAKANTKATQKINLSNTEIVGKDIRLFAGQNRSKSTNLILNTAVAQGFAASLFPNLVPPNANATIVENNLIDISGTSQLEAFADIDLVTREGIGGDERSFAGGDVFSLSVIPIELDAVTKASVDSNNDVNISSNSKLTAGLSSFAAVHIVPVIYDGAAHEIGNQPVAIGQPLNSSAKQALKIPESMDYHYSELNLGSLAFDFYKGFVIKPIAGNAPGANLNNYYQFLPSTINGAEAIIPHLENYGNSTRWKNLGALSQTQLNELLSNGQLVYESDLLVKLASQLTGKFAVVKPVDMDGANLVYRNVGNMLFAQYQQIKQWMAEHAGDVEAIARYQVQLEELEALMADLGLTSLLNLQDPPGETAITFNNSVNTLFVEVPSIIASPGSVFIETEPTNVALITEYQGLINSKVLNANSGATIDLTNASPFTMVSEGALAEDNQRVTVDSNGQYLVLNPGNVYLNKTPLTANASSVDSKITITQDALGPLNKYGLSNLPIPLPKTDQDLYINGDVINEDGNIKIENQEGSIYINGEVRGASVEILAARDFNLNTDGWLHTNRDPQQYIDYNAYRSTLFNNAEALRDLDQWVNLPVPSLTVDDAGDVTDGTTTLADAINVDESRILAQGDIIITARFLNVNGLVQSGSDEIELDISSSFSAPETTTNFRSENGKEFLPGISFGVAGVPVDGYWDAGRQAFVIEEIKPEGGRIRIAGQILSTGNGRLKAATGNPSVDIDNNTPYQVILEGIDTTESRPGFIEITDTHGAIPTRVQYKYFAASNTIEETNYNGSLQNGVVVYTASGPATVHSFNADIQFQPDANMHYVWTEGQRQTEQTISDYIKDTSWYTFLLFFVDFDESNLVDRETTALDPSPVVESETVEVEGDKVPSYAKDKAYSIKYERYGDPRVELKAGAQVLHPMPTFDLTVIPPTPIWAPGTAVYEYKGPDGAIVELSDVNYLDISQWEVVDTDFTKFRSEPKEQKYFSSFKNDSVRKIGPDDIGNDRLRLRTIRERGLKDLYTHTLKADYPIEIAFSKSPANPLIKVDSKGGILIIGDIQSPQNGAVELTSVGGSIQTESSSGIYGASPTVVALGNVDLNVEGGNGALNISAGGKVDVRAISLDNSSSSLIVGTIESLTSDVSIDAKDGLMNKDSSSKIVGNRVDLSAQSGAIGTVNSPLRVQSGSGNQQGLTALADGNIQILQLSGDLLLVRASQPGVASVESKFGDVTLIAANGSILDGDNEFKPTKDNPRSSLTKNFLNAGIAAGLWTTSSVKYPIAAGLVKFLYPHQNFLGQNPPSEMTERVNVRGQKVTLSAVAVGKEVGHVGDAIIINEPNNFSNLTDEQQSILANANATDVVGIAYGLYKYLGTDESNVDLTQENFRDSSRWLKLNTHFATGLNRSGDSNQLLQAGDRVRVEHDVDHYGVYQYYGPTEVLNLLQVNYLDKTRWIKLTGDAATDGGPTNLSNSMIIVNKFVVDSLILRPIQDVNVEAESHVQSTASYRTALESVEDLRILRVVSGDDMFLRSRGDVIDIGERLSPASIASGGEVVISSLGSLFAESDNHALRTQITPNGSLRVLATGGVDLVQVSDDTALSGIPVGINDLYLDRIDAGSDVKIVVDEGNLRINYVTSRTEIALSAQSAILDAFPAHFGIYVNIYVPSTAVPGRVNLVASSIGTNIAPLTMDIESGDLVTQTTGSQWVQAVSDLVATSMVSTSGSIVVYARNRVLVELIEALNGDVTIEAVGSILDFDGDAEADIKAIRISLKSDVGSVGQAGNDLEIDTADTATSSLDASASGDIHVRELAGRLNLHQVVSQGNGSIRLSTNDTVSPGDDIIGVSGGMIQALNGNVAIRSADNVNLLSAVTGRNVSIEADTVGTDAAGAIVVVGGSVTADHAQIETGDEADTVIVAALVLSGMAIRVNKGDDQVTGGSGDDLIFGGEGRDILRGGDGDDYLESGSGVGDELYGEGGHDTILGSAQGAETDPNFNDLLRFGDLIDGGEGNDTIRGMGGPDQIQGGAGNDWIEAGDGSDFVRGGQGNDTIYAGDGLIDEIHGDDDDDFIVGSNTGNDKLFGGFGDDRIYGQAGDDLVDAGEGHDFVDGGAGADVIFGHSGNDQLWAGIGTGDLIRGGDGDDLIHGSDDGADALFGEIGRDRIYGYSGNDSISGGLGDDIVEGGAGDDTISGDEGSDLLVGGANHDILYAYNLANLFPDNAVDYLYGDFGTGGNEPGWGADQLYGSLGRDLLFGEAGDDLIDDNLSIAGIPQPSMSLDLIDYGADEGPNPTTFTLPVGTPNPNSQTPPAPKLPERAAFPSGPSDSGRWGELSNSASDAGLNRSGITSAPSIASTSTGSVVAWSESYLGRSRIYVAQHNGLSWQELPTVPGTAVYGAATQSKNPSLIVTSSGLPTVAWTEHTSSGNDIMLAQYSPTANGGSGGWIALGNSLAAGGLSNSGTAENAQLLETSFGLVVVWQNKVAGVTQIHARRFDGSAWVSIGAGSDVAGGISNGNTVSDIRDVTVASRSGRVAIGWSQFDGASGQRQIYMREYDGNSWNSLQNSAIGLGVSAAVHNKLPGSVTENSSPSLAYFGADLLVAWQSRSDSLPMVAVARYSNSAAGLELVFTTPTSGIASQPTLISNGVQTQLAWQADATRIYVTRWNGDAMIEELPSEASGFGITSAGREISALTASMDVNGRASIGWLDLSEGQPNLMVRRNALANLGTTYLASPSGASIQSILDTQTLTAGDVIVVSGVLTGDINLTAADAGVLLIGKPGSKIVGNINVSGNQVGLMKLDVQGNIITNNSSQLTLRDSSILGRILIHGGTDNHLSHNSIVGGNAGIVLTGNTFQATVRHNKIDGATNAVSIGDPLDLIVGGATSAVIANNTITNATTGIRIRSASSGLISANQVYASQTGLDLDAPWNGFIQQNRFSQSAVGVRYEFPAMLSDNDVSHNTTGIIATVNSDTTGLGFQPGTLPNRIAKNSIGVELAGRMQNQFISENTTGVSGTGSLVSQGFDKANVIDSNQVGVNVAGTIQFQRISRNQVGVLAANEQTIVNNLITRNVLSIEINGKTFVDVQSNTFYTPVGTHIKLIGATEHVHLWSNIFWTEDGYNLYISNESTTGFSSNYNLLHTSGNGKIAYYTKDFTDLLDWQEDLAKYDLNSIGRTNVNPTWSDPRFMDRDHDDYRLFAQTARQRFSSPAIDAGLTMYNSIDPPPPFEPADLGAYSGTALDVAQPAHLILISPDLYEDWDRDRAITIRWQSFGNTDSSTINIDLYQDTPNGPIWIANIATGVSDTGQYAWMAADSGINYGTYGLRIQVSFTDNRTVLSRSTESFTVPESGRDYYVNDQVIVGDDFTSTVGNNRNTGKLPSLPKPYPNNVLGNYSLSTGDNLWVDTGNYALLNPLVITADKDLGGDDQGFTIQGAFGGPLTVLTHANPLTQSPIVSVKRADDVTLTDMVLTGGTDGLVIRNDSAGAKLLRLTAQMNSAHGIYAHAGTQIKSIEQVTASQNGGNGIRVEGLISSITDSVITGNGDTGLLLKEVGPVEVFRNVISSNQGTETDGISITNSQPMPAYIGLDDLSLQHGNRIFGNGRHGIQTQGYVIVAGNLIYQHTSTDAVGIQATGAAVISDNIVHGNTHGISLEGSGTLLDNRVYNNSGIGVNVTGADASRNVVYSNQIGIQSSDSVLTHNLVYDNNLIGVDIAGNTGSALINNTIHQRNGSAIQLRGSNADTQLRNNIVWAEGGRALETVSTAYSGTDSNYNDYFLTDGALLATWGGNHVTSLSAFQALTGKDTNSYSFDPSFVSPIGVDGVMGYVSPTSDGRDDDFHLQSTAGSFQGGSFAPVATNNGTGLPIPLAGAWQAYATHSLAIDAGAPADTYGSEPAPNGARINLGAFGNTTQASKSAIPYLNVLSPNGGDVWMTKGTYWILWNADDLNTGSTTYRIELMKGGALALNIAADAPDTGAFAWTIPSNLITGGDYTIRVTRSAGGALVDSSNATFTIMNTNVAPAFIGNYSFPAIMEDISSTTNLGTLVADMVAGRFNDPDGPAAGIAILAADNTHGTWEVSLDGSNFSDVQSQLTGGKLLLLAADAITRIRFRPAPNFFGNAAGISYVPWDQADMTAAGTAIMPGTLQVNSLGSAVSVSTITVTPVNDAPSDLLINNDNVKEKLPAGTVVGLFGSVDLDSAVPFSYTLVPGVGSNDNGKFTIVGDELRTAEIFDFESKPTHTIRVRTTDSSGDFFEKSFTIGVLNAPIKVTGIYVRGAGWNASYLAMLAANNLGSAIGGFRLIDGAGQLANSSLVTWQTIDQVSVTFDEAAVIDSNALRVLNGSNQDLAFAAGGYSYDVATRTARWTLSNPLLAGRFLISLEAAMIKDGASASLDGEWTTSVSTYATSGNNTAGGDLNFLFNYLPGDVSRSGQTNPGDVNLLRSLGTTIPNATNYWMDVTANNQINPGDVNFIRSLGTLVLSGGTPSNPPPPRPNMPELVYWDWLDEAKKRRPS